MPQAIFERTVKHGRARVIGQNSRQFTTADPLKIDTDGFLDIIDAVDERIDSVSQADLTMAADNQTNARVRPLTLGARDVLLVYGLSAAAVAADVGDFMEFDTLTTGTFRVLRTGGLAGATTALTDNRQVYLIQRDPYATNTNTEGLFKVAFPEDLTIDTIT